MKKASKSPGSTAFTEYDLSLGVRGKYLAERPAAEAVPVQVWVPLAEFNWQGESRQLTEHMWIRPGSAYAGYDKAGVASRLSEKERIECRETAHWLTFVRSAHDALSARASLNAFLIALWIVRPTLTHAALRFEEGPDGDPEIFRILERFRWIKGYVAGSVKDGDLDLLKKLMPATQDIYLARGRLRNALVLTFRGCVSSEWQSGFVCYAAAMEALLTYSRDRGLTSRLLDAYSKLATRFGKKGAKVTADEFLRLYAVRSDIVHGRAYDRPAGRPNLDDLAAFASLLRQLWKIVLTSQTVRGALESDDMSRAEFFASL